MKNTVQIEHGDDYSAEQLHEDLCRCIHEGDEGAWRNLNQHVVDITLEGSNGEEETLPG